MLQLKDGATYSIFWNLKLEINEIKNAEQRKVPFYELSSAGMIRLMGVISIGMVEK